MASKSVNIIFDFDGTLTDCSTNGFLKHKDIDVGEFWKSKNLLCSDSSWDYTLSYIYKMIQLQHTKTEYVEYGKKLKFYNGVENFFKKIKKENPNVIINFHIISLGIGDIIRNCSISKYFSSVECIEFHYENDVPIFPKKYITMTEKITYIKNILNNFDSDNKVIYIGDGETDIPSFEYVKNIDGLSISVHSNSKNYFDKYYLKNPNTHHHYSANYGTNSDLFKAINGYIKSV